MFKQRERGSTPSGAAQSDEQAMPRPLSIQVPDVHESMRLAGVKDVQLPTQSSGSTSTGKRLRSICCCGSRGCSIGPMTGVGEE